MSSASAAMIVPPDRLRDIVVTIFSAVGSTDREARLVADHLVEANLRGHDSHGVGMIPAYIANALDGSLVLNQTLSIAVDSGPFVICDGGSGVGQVMARDAMEAGIERAAQTGACIVGLRNSHHIGRIGHWAEQCATAGLISIHFVNVVSTPAVAPFGGTKARVGTNPFAVGIPRAGKPPIVVDFATSRLAAGKVQVALNKGVSIPEGALLDAGGHPTTDPSDLFTDPPGALVPFGEHKGWGLSVACELLGAALIGGKTQSGPKRGNGIINSMLSILVSPDRLGTRASLDDETNAFVSWVRSEATRASAILMPGDPERETRQWRKANGIPIDARTWDEIGAAAKSVGVPRLD
ncbi:malate/lactate/ureidoglycolate dehydrogenase [Microvirga yunnanensis]|uniref:malate/lactate/ureidoglycolate dehydrogenase n=1 Tax=Microvirga yunnanensis TaxID=2953740 RepID=UPI0021C8ACD4|nr:malate/lactate/ureidoglycolate dehydrogenase [Microvirga sp. HBU65207]